MEDLKKELEHLKNNGNIIVGVYQDKELVNIWKDEKTNILHLMSDLYNKQFLKNNNTKITNKYNYSDVQEIKVIEKRYNYDEPITTFEYIYFNIPTKCGYIDTLKINEVLNNVKN